MRAVIWDRYGPPEILRLEDVERPEPADDEVLVRVHASSVNRTDTGFRAGKPFIVRFFTGFGNPKWRIPGMELAGEVEAVGSAVTEFGVGDRVFGANVGRYGTHAEFVSVPESGPLAKIPSGLTFTEAATICDGGLLALEALRPADIKLGQRVLVYGASGSIGTAGVQLAKHLGAHVTAVCSTKHMDLVKSLGADELIDYTQVDFTKNGQRYDAIFDAVGKHSFGRSRRSLTPVGVYLPTDGLLNFASALLTSRSRGRRAKVKLPPRYRKIDVLLLKELVEAGTYRPVVDRSYPLEQIVEAHRYVETGKKTGNVAITVIPDPAT